MIDWFEATTALVGLTAWLVRLESKANGVREKYQEILRRQERMEDKVDKIVEHLLQP